MQREHITIRVHPEVVNEMEKVKMEYLIKLVSREYSAILDPFLGSGSTGIACKNLNRNFVGIELNPDYFQIAKARLQV